MIFTGYPGVGKSTLSSPTPYNLIDLESSNFELQNESGTTSKDPNWYKAYGNIAVDLSKQGFNVFISCQKWRKIRGTYKAWFALNNRNDCCRYSCSDIYDDRYKYGNCI